MKSSIICSIIVVFISIFIYWVVSFLEIFKKPQLLNENKCTYYAGVIGAEDIVNWNNIGIACSDDRAKLFYFTSENGPNRTQNGGFYAIFQDQNNKSKIEISPAIIKDFPSNVSLHPHGISLYKDKIYAINHAYGKGGERIEVFDISLNEYGTITLTYNSSIIFDNQENVYGIYNDLIILNENEFFITSWLPIPHTVNGTNNQETFWIDIKRIFLALFFKRTYVYYCSIKDSLHCSIVEGTASKMNNGIAYDGKKLIAVARPSEKKISLFNLNEKNGKKILNFIKDINLNYINDNIDYDYKTNAFYASIVGKLSDFFTQENMMKSIGRLDRISDILSGVVKIPVLNDPMNMDFEILFMQNELTGISVGTKFNDYVLIGSPFHEGISVCDVN